jgi:hypothetical protein
VRNFFVRGAIAIVLLLAVLIVVGALGAQRACAHDPRFACSPRPASSPIAITDVAKSWALYGHLRPGERDIYTIDVPSEARVPWSLLVDRRDAGNPARPFAAITTAAGHPVAHVDFQRSEAFYEPFSRERYLTTPDVALTLPPGRYNLTVGMRGGDRPQRYAMAIGTEERFTLTEIPYVLGAIHRIRTQNY